MFSNPKVFLKNPKHLLWKICDKYSNLWLLLDFSRDMPDKMTQSEIESLFRLSDICKTCERPVSTVEVSANSGQGLGEIIKWMDQNALGKGWNSRVS